MKSMLSSALFAGIAAGLLCALLQYLLVQPDIILAERYESGELVHFQGIIADGHDHSTHDHAAEAPQADAGSDLQRNILTLAFTLFTWCGFALVLMGAMRVTQALGHAISPAASLLWGLGGFLAVQMLPALGLAPELPGMPAADIDARQTWWLATVVASALGLWLLAYGRFAWQRVLGAGALALPHLYGAPEPEALGGIVPPELAAAFAAHSLGVNLIAWVVLGLMVQHFWRRSEAE